MITGQLALIAASAFTGASFYINAVEQPARFGLEPNALLSEWRLSYQRGTVMQISLSVLGAAMGVTTFAIQHDWKWLIGALILVLLLPYTLLFVMPVNRRLLSFAHSGASGTVHQEVRRWGNVHAGRTGLGLAAALTYLCASL